MANNPIYRPPLCRRPSRRLPRLPVKVRLIVEGKKPANAASMLAVLSLGATLGSEVVLEADEDEAGLGRAAVDQLAALLERDLDAESTSA